MSEQGQDGVQWWRNHPWQGRHLFAENRAKHLEEVFAKYYRQFVAWFPDGSGIFDADPDEDALRERVKASGDDPATYLIEYITDEAYI
jgi:hypothetical protein